MVIASADQQRWQVFADAVLPGTVVDARNTVEGGESHQVLVMPGHAVIRRALTADAAASMPRRLDLLTRLNSLDLPFSIPVPLSDAVEVGGSTVAALTFVAGSSRKRGSGGTSELRRLLTSLDLVDLSPLEAVLDVPHAYAGRERWAELLLDDVIPRLPSDVRSESRVRVEAALALPAVPHRLVHGDLAGANVLWHADGRLSGIVDWDLASPFDPAVDAACLAWFGWETVRAIVDDGTFQRAQTWFGTFGLEQVAAALLDLEVRTENDLDEIVLRTAQWVRRTSR